MDNTSIKTTKLNVSNIKSPLTGGGSDLGNVGQGGTSKIGTLAKIVRKNRISINSLVKSQETQDKKITILKNISQNRQNNIGQKLPGSDKGNIEKSLAETNQILVKIQQELMRASALRSKEEKAKSDRAKRGASRAKLGAEESQLEKSSKRIKKSVGEKAEQTMAPVKGMFGRIMEFMGTLALGIAGNAIFEWLKDKNNIEKINEWFGWIKDNWKWMVVAVGAIALLPVVSAISGLIGPIGAIVGLLLKGIPVLIGVLTNPVFLGFAAGAGLLLAGKATLDFFKRMGAGGEAHLNAFEALKEELAEAGITVKGSGKNEKFGVGKKTGRDGIQKSVEEAGSEEQKKLLASYIKRRDSLIKNKDDMKNKIKEERDAVVPIMTTRKSKGKEIEVEDRKATDKLRNEAESNVRKQYEGNISGILEQRKMGGPVTSKTPYIVGERGPEIFMPNINGSIINNMRTEKIYQMISSGKKGRGGINMINLPPITNQIPPPELPNMSGGEETEVPDISSTNMADPYRQLGPMLYGITV